MREILRWAVQLYILAIFGRIILSWFPLQPAGVAARVYEVLVRITEPLLGPLRRILPRTGMIDLSPLVALLVLQLVVLRVLA